MHLGLNSSWLEGVFLFKLSASEIREWWFRLVRSCWRAYSQLPAVTRADPSLRGNSLTNRQDTLPQPGLILAPSLSPSARGDVLNNRTAIILWVTCHPAANVACLALADKCCRGRCELTGLLLHIGDSDLRRELGVHNSSCWTWSCRLYLFMWRIYFLANGINRCLLWFKYLHL